MSTHKSLKNIIPKRKYRERSQPGWRKGKGFLEKKQDYKKRAVHYHKNQEFIKKMKIKAETKNPEEFYHAMINAREENGDVVRTQKFDPNFDETEFRKIMNTKNQGLVKYQKYRLSIFD